MRLDGPDRQGHDLGIPAVEVGKVQQGLLAHQLFGVDEASLIFASGNRIVALL
jgi:hypothetical protein